MDAPLKVILTTRDKAIVKDVTASHLFLGYKPVIIGLLAQDTDESFLSDHSDFCLTLVQDDFKSNTKWKDFPTDRDAVAMMILKKIEQRYFDGKRIYLRDESRG